MHTSQNITSNGVMGPRYGNSKYRKSGILDTPLSISFKLVFLPDLQNTQKPF